MELPTGRSGGVCTAPSFFPRRARKACMRLPTPPGEMGR
ncbi:hypothetical protein E2C01_094162 [Portunus trituberculatus]|uniref:Uncharacterized protein n=1 Tax=Portunus trituberculatus TaxID=210409 RepID=A0A5B7JPP9_PORTR|nr:hypothetical protein [Portunus trituberculatus]